GVASTPRRHHHQQAGSSEKLLARHLPGAGAARRVLMDSTVSTWKGSEAMLSSRGAKPLVSILLALLLVLAFVVPFLQYNFLAGPLTPFDKVQAGSIRYAIILAIALLW